MDCENEKYILEILLYVILHLQQTTLQRLTTAPCDEHPGQVLIFESQTICGIDVKPVQASVGWFHHSDPP